MEIIIKINVELEALPLNEVIESEAYLKAFALASKIQKILAKANFRYTIDVLGK